MEIAGICMHLRKLVRADVLAPDVRDACEQAATLLTDIRALVLERRPRNDNLEKLRELLAKQGEG